MTKLKWDREPVRAFPDAHTGAPSRREGVWGGYARVAPPPRMQDLSEQQRKIVLKVAKKIRERNPKANWNVALSQAALWFRRKEGEAGRVALAEKRQKELDDKYGHLSDILDNQEMHEKRDRRAKLEELAEKRRGDK